VAKRRKVANLLGLQLLALLMEKPIHPYEMASMLRERGKEHDLKINWGSLYTVVRNLEKHGFIEATETAREGRRPERTVYRITDTGHAELVDWLRELVGFPGREYPTLRTALSVLSILPPDQAIALLQRRLTILDADNAGQEATLHQIGKDVPRAFLIEAEYHLALRNAEAQWLRGVIAELVEGTMPGMDLWRNLHASGRFDAGKLDAGKLGAGKFDAGKLDAGKLGAGKLGAGQLDAPPSGGRLAGPSTRRVPHSPTGPTGEASRCA
jgi:DNA-binding PadR family transcriptional regulator